MPVLLYSILYIIQMHHPDPQQVGLVTFGSEILWKMYTYRSSKSGILYLFDVIF